MKQDEKKIKTLKISAETHNMLKVYCDKQGVKMYRLLERMIIDVCKEKPDIYGEN
jgi:hypothetical protein